MVDRYRRMYTPDDGEMRCHVPMKGLLKLRIPVPHFAPKHRTVDNFRYSKSPSRFFMKNVASYRFPDIMPECGVHVWLQRYKTNPDLIRRGLIQMDGAAFAYIISSLLLHNGGPKAPQVCHARFSMQS